MGKSSNVTDADAIALRTSWLPKDGILTSKNLAHWFVAEKYDPATLIWTDLAGDGFTDGLVTILTGSQTTDPGTTAAAAMGNRKTVNFSASNNSKSIVSKLTAELPSFAFHIVYAPGTINTTERTLFEVNTDSGRIFKLIYGGSALTTRLNLQGTEYTLSSATGSNLKIVLTFVYNSTTQKFRIYVNGVLDQEISTIVFENLIGTLYAGSTKTGGSKFAGNLGSILIYNRILTDAEVAAQAAKLSSTYA